MKIENIKEHGDVEESVKPIFWRTRDVPPTLKSKEQQLDLAGAVAGRIKLLLSARPER